MAMELGDIVALYLENLDLKASTIRDYRSILGTYLQYLKQNSILRPIRTDIIHYREQLWSHGLKASTIQKEMLIIRNFYKWVRINWRYYDISEEYGYDISEGLRGAKIEPTYKKEPLDIQQAKRLIDTAYQYVDSIQGARNYAMVLLMLITGLRSIEVARAFRNDISRLEGFDILYVQGKGRDDKELFVKLPAEIMTAIDRYFQMRTDEDPHLFVSHSHSVKDLGVTTKTIQEAVRELMRQADIFGPKISVHSLRHTCAYINLRAGGSLEATQQLLRHRNIETTLIYAHNINRLKDESENRIAGVLFPGRGDQ